MMERNIRQTTTWTPELKTQLLELYALHCDEYNKWQLISKEMGISAEAARNCWRRFNDSPKEEFDTSSKVEYGDDTIYVVQASRRIMSQKELMEAYKINPDEFKKT